MSNICYLPREISCNVPVHVLSGVMTPEDDELWELPKRDPLGLSGEFGFSYSYPLTREVIIKRELTPDITAFDLLLMGRADYERIYREEDKDVGHKTGSVSGMLNRQRSNGRHGIWGHVIQDLWFESINIDIENKSISFGMGS